MRLFQREANFIREAAYSNFCVYQNFWVVAAKQDFDDEDCPTISNAYDRAMNQQKLADFLDPQGRFNFWLRYFLEHKEIHPSK